MIVSNGETGLSVRTKINNVFAKFAYDVKAYGAVGDGVTDDTSAILSACSEAAVSGQQNVYFPPGTYAHKTLDLTDKNVRLIGSGSVTTTLKYTGANTSDGIKFGSSSGATTKANGCGLVQITVNANSLARRAVEITSVDSFHVDGVRILNPYEYGMYWTCLDNRLVSAGNAPADNQRAFVNDLYVECITPQTATAIFLDGNAGTAATTGANTSLNHFQNIRLNIRNGNGMVFGNCDANTVIGLFVFRPPANTGIGAVFKEDTTGTERHSRHNIGFNIQTSRSSILAEGSGTGNASENNSIFGYNLGNNGIDFPPTVGASASLSIWTNQSVIDGNISRAVFSGGATLTQQEAYVTAIRSRVTSESARFSNTSSNHIVLERPSADRTTVEGQWGISVIGASGSAGEDLRIARASGTGCFQTPGIAQTQVAATGATTTLTNQSAVVVVDASAGNKVINLPVVATYPTGKSPMIQIVRTDASANTVTVQRQGSDTINGTTSETLSANQGKTYVCDSVSAWYSF